MTINQSPEAMDRLVSRIKEIVDRTEDASDSDSSIGEAQTNRFNKLKRKSRHVASGRLNAVDGLKTDTKQSYYAAGKRMTIAKLERDVIPDEEDAYYRVAVDQILAPITTPGEVVHHTAHRITFRRQTLPVLASHALQTISTEHEHRVQLSRLLTAFLGDDPSLIMQKYETDNDGTSLQTPLTLASSLVKDDSAVAVKATTRKTAAAEESLALARDFITPGYDRNLGLPHDEAEEARRLLQAALDRSEEYLRCMQKVRSGLVKADRYRTRTWQWCKDANKSNERETI